MAHAPQPLADRCRRRVGQPWALSSTCCISLFCGWEFSRRMTLSPLRGRGQHGALVHAHGDRSILGSCRDSPCTGGLMVDPIEPSSSGWPRAGGWLARHKVGIDVIQPEENATRQDRARDGPAGLIAAVAILAITAHGDFARHPDTTALGYTVLARSLGEGHGYRDRSSRPSLPVTLISPGYPVFLPWSGECQATRCASHVASGICTVAATLASWWWFRRLYGRDVALVLGLALAVNWAWAEPDRPSSPSRCTRCSGSSPFWPPLGRPRKGDWPGYRSAGLMAACLLTRHIAIALVLAVLLDSLIRRRWLIALTAVAVTVLLIAPWVGWLLFVGANIGHRRAWFCRQARTSWPERLAQSVSTFSSPRSDHRAPGRDRHDRPALDRSSWRRTSGPCSRAA
jgi:hypothetical protein